MRKFITVILQVDGNKEPLKTITIESVRPMHEVEVYAILEKLVPAYLKVNYDDAETLEGYSVHYANGLSSVTIYSR